MMSETLTLKWGTLKGWSLETEQSMAALRRCFDGGREMSAMCQRDTPEQKEALCDLIDVVDGEVWNDWEERVMSREEAKHYVREYGRNAA